MNTHQSLASTILIFLASLFLIGCQALARESLPPDEYLDHALNWLETNAVAAAGVDWEMVRAEAVAMAGQQQTTAGTYPAIEYALEQLKDPQAFMITPDRGAFDAAGLGITAVYPQNIIVEVKEGGPAAEADIRVGDRVLAINGASPMPEAFQPHMVDFQYDALTRQAITLALQRGDRQWEITLEEEAFEYDARPASQALPVANRTAAYLELPTDFGTRMYPTQIQAAMAAVDGPDTCGWIIDLRRNRGGDLWTYFAGLSPLLGEGKLGGFVYPDGKQEPWKLLGGKVYWADEERDESYVRGPLYELEKPSPAVALLISPLTEAAGELVVVAFQGWGNVRTFGEVTLGTPNLITQTTLSDEARLFVSGAQGMDRNGTVYNGSIEPDAPVTIDWQNLGGADDPVIAAALVWLAAQPVCAQ